MLARIHSGDKEGEYQECQATQAKHRPPLEGLRASAAGIARPSQFWYVFLNLLLSAIQQGKPALLVLPS